MLAGEFHRDGKKVAAAVMLMGTLAGILEGVFVVLCRLLAGEAGWSGTGARYPSAGLPGTGALVSYVLRYPLVTLSGLALLRSAMQGLQLLALHRGISRWAERELAGLLAA